MISGQLSDIQHEVKCTFLEAPETPIPIKYRDALVIASNVNVSN